MGSGARTRRPFQPRRGRRGALVMLVVAGALALMTSPAAAARPSLPNTWGSTHFVIHYDPAVTPVSTAQTVAADAEEGYVRLVTGGGGTPNAGLRAPIDDGDHKTDVYLTTWSGDPSYSGGVTLADGTAPYAAWYILTPDLSLPALRFRAVHEFLHVIQQAYQPNPASAVGGMWTESTANWAVEWSLADVDPGDSNWYDDPALPAPWLPLDCSYGTWPATGGRPCGNGYWQWLFMQRQVEDYGVDFISGLLERVRACVAACSSTSTNTAMLNSEIVAQSGGGATLASRFERYAWQVWDPTAWATTAVATLQGRLGRPPATTWTRANLSSSGYSGSTYAIDHLATRYVLVRNLGDTSASGPGDTLQVILNSPSAGETYLTRATGASTWVAHAMDRTGGSVPFDPATTREALLPLTNATLTDAGSFAYGVKLARGTATPPANDAQSGAAATQLDVTAQTDTVYAGGRGDLEAGSCGTADMTSALNGVWFRFVAPNAGQYRFSATASAFAPVVVLRAHGTTTFDGCSASNGVFSLTLTKGEDVDVYLGRWGSDTGDGTLAQLNVSGPPSNTAAPTVAGTARDGSALSEAGLGAWTGSPTGTTRQWRRCNASGAACAAIAGAAGTSYTLTSADIGSTIRLLVTRSNGYGSGTGESAATAVVAARPPVNETAPSIAGTAQQGRTLAATSGTWSGSPPITLTRRWERCSGATCTAVAGANAGTYTLTGDDVGHQLRAVVIAHNAGGDAEAASALTAMVTTTAPAPTTPATGTTSPGTTTPAVPGALPVRTVALAGRTARPNRRGRVALRLRCTSPDGLPCAVTVTLRTAAPVKVGGKRRVVTLATGRATLTAGRTGTVTLTLNAGGRRLVARLRRVRATLVSQVREPDGSAHVARAGVILLAR